MRNNLALMILALAASAPIAIAAAHGDPDGPPRGDRVMEHMLDTVDATDAQRTQIKAIHDKYEPQMEQIHQQARKLHAQMHHEIEGVLTAEQKAKLDSEETAFHHRRHHLPHDAE